MFLRALLAGVAILSGTSTPIASTREAPVVSVSERDGTFIVSARFGVQASAAIARDVLTDYANIPRFAPDVRSSVVLERRDGGARVAQEAVSSFLMFSRRIHLVLDVEEGTDVIAFRDTCGRSFERYEGAWKIGSTGAETMLTYELTARPAFSVPGFVLRRLLNRDATVMIDRLRAEIGARLVL